MLDYRHKGWANNLSLWDWALHGEYDLRQTGVGGPSPPSMQHLQGPVSWHADRDGACGQISCSNQRVDMQLPKVAATGSLRRRSISPHAINPK